MIHFVQLPVPSPYNICDTTSLHYGTSKKSSTQLPRIFNTMYHVQRGPSRRNGMLELAAVFELECSSSFSERTALQLAMKQPH